MARIKSKWWRPDGLARLTRLTDSMVRSQEQAYRSWLGEARGWTAKQVEVHIAAQLRCIAEQDVAIVQARREAASVIGRCVVRKVRSYAGGMHYGLDGWRKTKKPDAPAVYAVIRDGAWVNSFLTKGRAVAYAEALQ